MTRQKEGVKLEVPNLYNISGSSNFYNKTDNGITVYRDFDENNTKVFVQKVKFSHWGEIGVAEFDYQLESGRFLTNFNDVNSWLPQVKPIEVEIAPFPMIALEDVKTVFDNDLPFDENFEVPF
jgi:hypothetical protein